MERMTFINLPIQDLKRTMDFYGGLGFEFNPQFTSEDTTCMIVSDTSYVMFLEHKRFLEFVDKPITDTHSSVTALIALSCNSAKEARDLCEKAFSLGARNFREPQDLGFMFSWAFEDLNGHVFEPFWMDMSAATTEQP